MPPQKGTNFIVRVCQVELKTQTIATTLIKFLHLKLAKMQMVTWTGTHNQDILQLSLFNVDDNDIAKVYMAFKGSVRKTSSCKLLNTGS